MASNHGQDWDIKSPGAVCCSTQRGFEDQEQVMSRLVYNEEGYQREDYGMDQWNDALQETALSYWKSVYRAPAEKEPEPFGLNDAEGLLRNLMEGDRSEHLNTIFVLAAMLERKRILVEREVQHPEEGHKVRVFEHKKSGDTFIVIDPQLHLDELEAVQMDIAIALGWKPPKSEEELAMEQVEAVAEELAEPSGDEGKGESLL